MSLTINVRNIFASTLTQQALCALLLLFTSVLESNLPRIEAIHCLKRPSERSLVLMSRAVNPALAHTAGVHGALSKIRTQPVSNPMKSLLEEPYSFDM
ncbi:hypothetical protein [Noviherbaspirillum malthae]|uniref:hypothetical protein n=1 Tax=Noviherbaspirillum malthae TaxID=1260987 RepID=UPI00188EEF92|nr:hypothetical protein [Noviherbaspirillum malthae]